jgi:hypothetical protein
MEIEHLGEINENIITMTFWDVGLHMQEENIFH